MSLKITHPLWTSCGNNSFEISKAMIQAKLLSGQYRTDTLLCNFGKNSTTQYVLCKSENLGSIEHLLVVCDKLKFCRDKQFESLEKRSNVSDLIKKLIYDAYNTSISKFVQILLDCSVMAEVIQAKKLEANIICEIFKFTRTWCFNIHVNRMKLLGRWTST